MANAAFQCITNRWQHREMPLVTTYYFAILLQMKKKRGDLLLLHTEFIQFSNICGGLSNSPQKV